MTPSSSDPAEARKRRKEIIQSQRSENELLANGVAALAATNGSKPTLSTANGINGENGIIGAGADGPSNTAATDANGNGTEKKPPKKRKVASGDSSSRKNGKKNGSESSKLKKTQIRYDPDVPMSKDQLAAWRREARRVRNRESAAASRQRIRNRISELEDEVGEWKTKYTQAIQRLEALEKCISNKQEATDQPAAQPAAASAEGIQE